MQPRVKGHTTMLHAIAVILLIAWLLGVVGTHAIGAFVYVILVVALVMFFVGLLAAATQWHGDVDSSTMKR